MIGGEVLGLDPLEKGDAALLDLVASGAVQRPVSLDVPLESKPIRRRMLSRVTSVCIDPAITLEHDHRGDQFVRSGPTSLKLGDGLGDVPWLAEDPAVQMDELVAADDHRRRFELQDALGLATARVSARRRGCEPLGSIPTPRRTAGTRNETESPAVRPGLFDRVKCLPRRPRGDELGSSEVP